MARPRTPPVINPQAYAPTVWQDGVTPVNAANLNKLEQGLAAAVGIPADVVVSPATALLIRNRLNAADTQPAFRLGADGKQEFGPGGSTAPDTNLYRSAAGSLKTDGGFSAVQIVKGGAGNAWEVGMGWGGLPGAAAGIYFGPSADTNLYRSGAGVLKTDGHFAVGGYLDVDRNGVGSQLRFGSAMDTNLYRSSAGYLTTDGGIIAKGVNNGLIYSPVAAGGLALMAQVQGEAQPRFYIDYGGYHRFGPGGATAPDTNLFRPSPAVLQTDGAMAVGGMLWSMDDTFHPFKGIGFGAAQDVKLYRSAAGVLKTDGMMDAATGFLARGTGAAWALRVLNGAEAGYRFGVDATGKLLWDSGAGTYDTYLYRNSTSSLATNAFFYCNGLMSTSYIQMAGQAAGAWAHVVSVSGEAGNRLVMDNTGAMNFGSGAAGAGDTLLQRLSPGVLGINGVPIGLATRTRQYPLKIQNPRSSSDTGNAFWTVFASTYDVAHWEFVRDVQGRVTGQILIPKSVAATPNAKIVLILGAAVAGVSRMSVQTFNVPTNGGGMNTALHNQGAQDISLPGAYATVRATFPITVGGAPAADQLMVFEITHEGAHANDTLAGNTMLFEAYLEIEA